MNLLDNYLVNKTMSVLGWLWDEIGFIVLLAIIGGLSYKAGTRTKTTIVTEVHEVVKEVEVRVKTIPGEFTYCDEKSCIWATPDGLRIRNYTDKSLFCKSLPITENLGVRAENDWWAIGRPGPFLTCNPKE